MVFLYANYKSNKDSSKVKIGIRRGVLIDNTYKSKHKGGYK